MSADALGIKSSDEERAEILLLLARADGQPWESIAEATPHTAEIMYGDQADAVERILAAREQALREEIAQQIEADRRVGVPPSNDYRIGYRDGHEDGRAHAARIARGETR